VFNHQYKENIGNGREDDLLTYYTHAQLGKPQENITSIILYFVQIFVERWLAQAVLEQMLILPQPVP
jgi:hypothetical protein